jgi:hypothetical protein
MNIADPLDFIRAQPHGTVIYGFTEESGKYYIDFLIRESSSELEKLLEQPPIESRAGAVIENGALIVVVGFKLRAEGRIYETFWNYHPVQQGLRQIFEHMCAESVITFNFVGDSGEVENVVQATNTLQAFFRDITQQAAAMKPWTPAAFDEAKLALTENFESPEELWNSLDSIAGATEGECCNTHVGHHHHEGGCCQTNPEKKSSCGCKN